MEFHSRKFWLPKKGYSSDEYEDAWDEVAEAGCFAIADGATESSFASSWASSLVRGFVQGPIYPAPEEGPDFVLRFKAWLDPLQHAWREGVPWDRLPWFAVDKAREGAFASLLGLEFLNERSRCWGFSRRIRWRSLAVGDSCLFQIRRDQLVNCFPLDRAEQFGIRPVLLSSNPVNNRRALNDVVTREGTCVAGDLFLLATDALSHWFLERYEANEKPWLRLVELEEAEEFESLVDTLRTEHAMRNDDTTLVLVRVVSGGAEGTSRRGRRVAPQRSSEGEAAPTTDAERPPGEVAGGEMIEGERGDDGEIAAGESKEGQEINGKSNDGETDDNARGDSTRGDGV